MIWPITFLVAAPIFIGGNAPPTLSRAGVPAQRRVAISRLRLEAGGYRRGQVRDQVVPDERAPASGVVMAQNRGLDTDVFTNETDAIRWLDKRAGVRA